MIPSAVMIATTTATPTIVAGVVLVTVVQEVVIETSTGLVG